MDKNERGFNKVTGSIVRSYRQAAGWSQRQVAEAIGLKRHNYVAREYGRVRFTTWELFRLSCVFDVSTGALIPRKAPRTPATPRMVSTTTDFTGIDLSPSGTTSDYIFTRSSEGSIVLARKASDSHERATSGEVPTSSGVPGVGEAGGGERDGDQPDS